MPVILSEQKDRALELIAELVDKIDEHIATPPEPPVVNVAAPSPVVNVSAPPAAVNVTPAPPSKVPWTFHVERDDKGRIQTITATPKS